MGEKFVDIIEKELWHKAGMEEGKKYRAWYLIIENPSQFIEYFRNASLFENYFRNAFKYWENIESGVGIKQRLEKVLVEFDKAKPEGNATHREIVIAHDDKVKVADAEPKSPVKWKVIGGAKRMQAAYSTIKGGRTTYKAPSAKELSTVKGLLQDSPKALHLATNDLDDLQSL